MHGPLAPAATAFVDAVAAALGALSGRGTAAHRDDAAIEASHLVAAVVDADGRHTDAELDAFLDSIGSVLDPPLVISASRLREGGSLAGRAGWLASPSELALLFLDADRERGTSLALAYYGAALGLAHAVASVDLVPSAAELDAIGRLRSALLAAFDARDLPRPGRAAVAPVDAAAVPTPPTPPGAPSAPVADGDPTESLEAVLAELDELVGLAGVKQEVHRLTSLLQVQRRREERGLPIVDTSLHLVFTGNPGTGKTTVARLLSRIFRALGLLSRGHLVEADRSSLVAGYVGQTAPRTRAVLETAIGGTVLIDEAYALARGSEQDFGIEAVDALVAFMENHRDDLAVIAAGYPEEMAEFIATNPGLESRFSRTLHFEDYSDEQLVEIFDRLGRRHRYHSDADALAALRDVVAAAPRGRGFGNARFVRNLFESAVARHAVRVAPIEAPTDEQLTTLTPPDIAG